MFGTYQVTGTWSGSESSQSLLRVNMYDNKKGMSKF